MINPDIKVSDLVKSKRKYETAIGQFIEAQLTDFTNETGCSAESLDVSFHTMYQANSGIRKPAGSVVTGCKITLGDL